MPTIAEQLTKLIEIKAELANNLTVRGVEVSASATFNDLVPQVLNVEDVTDETTAYTNLNTKLRNVINSLPSAKAISLQEKTITPATFIQTVEPDSSYDGLSKVIVDAMPTVAQATPSITISSSGLITAKSIQLTGYVEGGTKSATKQLTTQGAKTITPSTSSQTAVASGVYTTGAITVGAIPSSYVKPTYTKGATTYTPKTTNQTIAAKTYCSGTQTIKGDANLIASNIKSGVSIFGVAGSYEGSGGSGDNTIQCLHTYVVFNDTVLLAMMPDVFTFDADNYSIFYYDDGGMENTLQNLTISIDDTDAVTITYQVGPSPITVYSSDTGWAEDYYKTIKLDGNIPITLMEILCGIATIGKTPSSDISEEVAEYTGLNTELEEVINSLPSAGAGGGGSLETVEFSLQTATPYVICYNTLANGVVIKENYVKSDSLITNNTFTVLKDVWLNIMFYTYNALNVTINGGEYDSLGNLFGSNIRCERVKFEQDGSVTFTENTGGWD